jgi:hypothetical protein
MLTHRTLGSAALFLFVPAMVMLKNANNRGSGAKMADSSAQWDDGDGEVIEVDTINSYQSTEGAEEYGEESTGLDLATIGNDVPRLWVQAPITCQSGEGLKPIGRTLGVAQCQLGDGPAPPSCTPGPKLHQPAPKRCHMVVHRRT